jgi:hypothetical protein
MDSEEEFRTMISQHCLRTGFEMPLLLSEYLTQLLDTHLDLVTVVPEPSFTQCFLSGHRQLSPKLFADQCLLFSSLLPEWEGVPGLTAEYYAQIGSSSYALYAHRSGDLRFHQLAFWFEPLQRFLASMILHHCDSTENISLLPFELNIQLGMTK